MPCHELHHLTTLISESIAIIDKPPLWTDGRRGLYHGASRPSTTPLFTAYEKEIYRDLLDDFCGRYIGPTSGAVLDPLVRHGSVAQFGYVSALVVGDMGLGQTAHITKWDK